MMAGFRIRGVCVAWLACWAGTLAQGAAEMDAAVPVTGAEGLTVRPEAPAITGGMEFGGSGGRWSESSPTPPPLPLFADPGDLIREVAPPAAVVPVAGSRQAVAKPADVPPVMLQVPKPVPDQAVHLVSVDDLDDVNWEYWGAGGLMVLAFGVLVAVLLRGPIRDGL